LRIDLHTHSLASDGTDTPGDLIRAAAAAGLDVVAITDHDTAVGWSEAAQAADEVGITLVRGIEVSTRFAGRSVHLLAYLPDPEDPVLVQELRAILEGRNARVPGIVEQLRAHDIEITVDDVLREADSSEAAGRPHVADALVRLGLVHHRNDAFSQWLNPGRPGYVRRHAPEVADMVRIVRAAGGVPVVAHPWGRGAREALTAEALADLREAGLAGIEVDHQDHAPADREVLRGLAGDLDLLVFGSSDYHGIGKIDHDLGVHQTPPEVFERLVDLAAETGRASGRDVPAVVGPRS
jgi:predicted metal-dependent phosphoesterase TrpH